LVGRNAFFCIPISYQISVFGDSTKTLTLNWELLYFAGATHPSQVARCGKIGAIEWYACDGCGRLRSPCAIETVDRHTFFWTEERIAGVSKISQSTPVWRTHTVSQFDFLAHFCH
jgi:hypothetical protein